MEYNQDISLSSVRISVADNFLVSRQQRQYRFQTLIQWPENFSYNIHNRTIINVFGGLRHQRGGDLCRIMIQSMAMDKIVDSNIADSSEM